jgi:hypothetical protein
MGLEDHIHSGDEEEEVTVDEVSHKKKNFPLKDTPIAKIQGESIEPAMLTLMGPLLTPNRTPMR